MQASAMTGGDGGAGETRVRHLRLVRAATIGPKASILDALGLLRQEPSGVLLTSHRGRPALLTQGDVERVLPSPASSLARNERSHRSACGWPTPSPGRRRRSRLVRRCRRRLRRCGAPTGGR